MNRILLALFLIAGTLHGQPAFEAVSIKPAAPDRRGMGMNISPGRIRIINVAEADHSDGMGCERVSSVGSGWVDGYRALRY